MAVFASLLLTSRACEATCGDYLHADGHSAMPGHVLPDAATGANGGSENVAVPAVPHRPCHGPRCSGGSFPSPEPVGVIVVSIGRWALAPDHSVTSDANSARDYSRLETSDLVVDGFRLDILRPPR